MTEPNLACVADLLRRQDGVVRRRQLLERGLSPAAIRRLLRRRALAAAHPGVYVDHTGALSWSQRQWAAIAACWPAALRADTALQLLGVLPVPAAGRAPIELVVPATRHPNAPDGVHLRRSRHTGATVLWHTSPPRQRPEYAALEVAAYADRQLDAVAPLAAVVGGRHTTGERLAHALETTPQLPRRHFLEGVIGDVRHGTCSVLEHGYLTRVERPHGLPIARRQVHESLKGSLYRDVLYEEQGAIVELDGRVHHGSAAARDRDMERDLDAFATDRVTARVGWGQVFDRACSTAIRIAAGLRARGWDGAVRRCPDCPSDTDPSAWTIAATW